MTGDQQSQGEATSLDDFPIAARLATRQQLLVKWYRGLALAPFVAVLFVVLKFFPDSTSVIPVLLVEATLVWAIVIAGYSFYATFFGARCGRCGNRYGSGDNCKSCGLPRHASSPTFIGD